MTESRKTSFFTPKLYDGLKFIAQIFLPALGTLYFTIGGIWHLTHTTEVVGTITAVDLFLGVLLGISSNQYYKSGANFDGDVNVKPTESGERRISFSFNEDPQDLVDKPGKHSIEFRVNKPDS